MTVPSTPPPPPPRTEALNPDLKRGHDATFDEGLNGSTPLDTISVKKNGPAVWPIIWAVATIILVAITLYLLFG